MSLLLLLMGGGGGVSAVTASANITEAADSASALSSVAVSATGNLAETGDAAVAVAGVAIAASLAKTETGDSLVASGTVGLSPALATLVVDEAADSVSSVSSVALSAVFDQGESADTLTAGAEVSSGPTATLEVTEQGDSVVALASIEGGAIDPGWLGGGADLRFMDRGQGAEAKQQERERLGIVPAKVRQAVEAVAKVDVTESPAESLADTRREREAVAKLAKALEQAQIAWDDFYAELLREERRRLIDAEIAWRMQALLEEQDEEQAILLLLAEL